MKGNLPSSSGPVGLEAVPLFPLPNVVLFPNALLPLHIFEERYKAMTADALAGQRRIAMALLSDGWPANIPPNISVVGQIRSLLWGAMRTADIADMVAFHLLDDVSFKQSILADGDIRRRVNRLLKALNCLETPLAEQFLHGTAGPADPSTN